MILLIEKFPSVLWGATDIKLGDCALIRQLDGLTATASTADHVHFSGDCHLVRAMMHISSFVMSAVQPVLHRILWQCSPLRQNLIYANKRFSRLMNSKLYSPFATT